MEEETNASATQTPDSGEPNQKGADVYSVVSYALHLFASYAWQRMGFIPDPLTGENRVDLVQAKIAIDCADFLAGQLQPHLEEESRRELQRQMRDLKVNYLDKITQEGSKEA